jgi:3-oxoadipate enol-lactonase
MRVSTPRGAFAVRTSGEDGGAPLLLLHPLALSGEVWAPVAEWFADRGRRVLALDARGHGDSDWNGRPFTVEDMAEDAAAVVTALDIPAVDVLGMSMGGSTAVALATGHPALVRRLVLADATSCYGPERVQTWEDRAQKVEQKPREELIGFQLDRWFSAGFREADPAECRRLTDVFLATKSPAHAAACRALGAFDQSDRLGEISAPTLVLVGDEDYATPVAMAEELARGIAGARLEVLPATRHLSLVENRAAWTTVDEHLGRAA